MFTGIIRHAGRLAARGGNSLRIDAPPALLSSLQPGDSIAVNGVCLTAVRLAADGFAADLLPATLAATTLGELPVGATLNLEPALRAGEPLGGHLVQGHIDGTTILNSISGEKYSFALPDWLRPWLVPKGSICIDGVSLTVQALGVDSFTVELIPETLARTSLGGLQPGQRVNLEADLIVKTVSELARRHFALLAGNQDQN